MCGICGFTGGPDPAALRRMMHLLHHRGPDTQGEFHDDRMSLGFRRLSIIDLATGNQPMSDSDGSLWVIFNGEIFNFKELRRELEGAGYGFHTNSDTEVLLHGHREWGANLPTKLIGMFAYALWEPGTGTLTLCRDRLGVKPLYYAHHEGRLLFASEPKAILSFHEFPRSMDRAAAEAFLTYLYVPGPSTIFTGIRHLPPGHQLTWSESETQISRYWEIPPVQEYEADEGKVLAELRRLVHDAVERRLMSEVPLGVFLSGGLDSSILVHEMCSIVPAEQVKTFTVGFEGHTGTFNEVADAKAVADHYGVSHTVYTADAEVLEHLPEICWHLDAPFANSSSIPMYAISRLAKKEITVALTGVGGDELFAGYPRDLAAVVSEDYRKLPPPLRRLAGNLVGRLPESTTGRAGTRRLKEFTKNSSADPDEEYVTWLSCFKTDERRELLVPSAEATNAAPPESIYIQALRSGYPDMLTRVLRADVKVWLPYNLLEYSDKLSMASSIENRVPLLDHRLVEFAFRVHPRLKIRGFRGKYALRRAYAKDLPRRVFAKKKSGFVAPLGHLYQKELKGLVGQILAPAQVRSHGLFRDEYVQRLLADHAAGRRDRTNQLTGLILMDLWHKLYLEGADLDKPTKPLSQFY